MHRPDTTAGQGPAAVRLQSNLATRRGACTHRFVKRDEKSGKFLDVKADPKPFKGVRKTKGR